MKDRFQPLPPGLNDLARRTVDAAYEVHKATGPGLLEQYYVAALARELELRGITSEAEVPVPARYKGATVGHAYRLDLLVGGELVVEVKALEELHPVHKAQVLTYLKLTGRRLGLLVNFGGELLKRNVKRVIL